MYTKTLCSYVSFALAGLAAAVPMPGADVVPVVTTASGFGGIIPEQLSVLGAISSAEAAASSAEAQVASAASAVGSTQAVAEGSVSPATSAVGAIASAEAAVSSAEAQVGSAVSAVPSKQAAAEGPIIPVTSAAGGVASAVSQAASAMSSAEAAVASAASAAGAVSKAQPAASRVGSVVSVQPTEVSLVGPAVSVQPTEVSRVGSVVSVQPTEVSLVGPAVSAVGSQMANPGVVAVSSVASKPTDSPSLLLPDISTAMSAITTVPLPSGSTKTIASTKHRAKGKHPHTTHSSTFVTKISSAPKIPVPPKIQPAPESGKLEVPATTTAPAPPAQTSSSPTFVKPKPQQQDPPSQPTPPTDPAGHKGDVTKPGDDGNAPAPGACGAKRDNNGGGGCAHPDSSVGGDHRFCFWFFVEVCF